jgi:uncharacterized protein YigA (DUF484 family)
MNFCGHYQKFRSVLILKEERNAISSSVIHTLDGRIIIDRAKATKSARAEAVKSTDPERSQQKQTLTFLMKELPKNLQPTQPRPAGELKS